VTGRGVGILQKRILTEGKKGRTEKGQELLIVLTTKKKNVSNSVKKGEKF